MRMESPQELPRKRAAEAPHSAPPLEPSPVERRRESLASRAADRRVPQVSHDKRDRPVRPERSREPRRRAVTQDRPMDQRSRREAIPQQVVGLPLREEERKVLAEVGRFRVVTTRDLSETVYDNRHSRMERDLAFLREKGLVQVDAVNARRDGRGGRVERIEVVTLTRAGRDVARQTSGLAQDQKLYAGLVKPREAEHDAQIYRAYRKEAERIEQKGGTNLRVRLDFELKSDVQKAIHAARRAEPERDMGEIKQQVAQQVELPYVNDGIQIPDARIEYDMDQGSRTGHEDIEVLTAAYRPGHLRNKAQAGFHNYASSSDRATLSAKIEDDQHLMENILEL
jgi:DNA-binding transcriptional ArsR family regulator